MRYKRPLCTYIPQGRAPFKFPHVNLFYILHMIDDFAFCLLTIVDYWVSILIVVKIKTAYILKSQHFQESSRKIKLSKWVHYEHIYSQNFNYSRKKDLKYSTLSRFHQRCYYDDAQVFDFKTKATIYFLGQKSVDCFQWWNDYSMKYPPDLE